MTRLDEIAGALSAARLDGAILANLPEVAHASKA